MERKNTDVVKKLFKMINPYIVQYGLMLFLMDWIVRGLRIDDGKYYKVLLPVPNIFSFEWIILFITIILLLRGTWRRILYWVIFSLFCVLFLTQCIYFNLTGVYFSFHLLQSTDEGTAYIWDTLVNTNPLFYIMVIVFIICAILLDRKISKIKPLNIKKTAIIIVCFVIAQCITPMLLGHADEKVEFNTFTNSRNVYDNFSNSYESMRLSGLYEYSFRNFYVTYIRPKDKMTKQEKELLEKYYKVKNDKNKKNEYTGLFKNKNVIFLQLEGMDSWLLNKKNTPTLYSLKNKSIEFTNFYSMYTGAGSTFNSEFAVNTGFLTPISYAQNAYTLNEQVFPNTLAKLFKSQKYDINAFHMNYGSFYQRNVNYLSWGYDKYFGLLDIKKYNDNSYQLDRELLLNKTFYNHFFKHKNRFLNYIITYNPHVPFNTEEDPGKLIAKKQYRKIPKLSEEETVKMMVGETDYMVELLIKGLKKNGLYDNTVIVAYADHYLYTLKDKSIIKKYKGTSNNLVNNTPFFIWSKSIKPVKINKVTMQTNVLPTVLNLFGIKYDSSLFIGQDALDSKYKGIAFFPDYSYYDGKKYVEMGKDTDLNDSTSKMVNDMIMKNDLTLKYDYLRDK